MGKKAKLKRIRKAAENLPVIMRNCHENHIRTGAELLRQGITEIDGKPVIVGKVYSDPMPVQIAVNHSRRLKKLVQEYGEDIIPAYLEANK